MTLSIKSIGGVGNEIPSVTNLKVIKYSQTTIDIEYKVEDVELTICRHYLYLNGSKREITKAVGYESSNNVFKYQITGLTKNTPYTIQIGASDGHDEGLSKAVQQSTQSLVIYGIKVMENNSNSNTCCSYIESAVGITPATPTSLGGWTNTWPFNQIRMVGFKNGVVTKEINPNNKKYYKDGYTVPDDVDVMVEIPKIYWDFKKIYNGYELRISDSSFNSTCDCYAHKVNGVEKDYIYVGAYLGCVEYGKLRSKSGVEPLLNQPLTFYRQMAKANGNGYKPIFWLANTLVEILYLIAFKNLNSQNALGKGHCDNTRTTTTGGTDTKGFVYGSQSTSEQMCFLGIEDFWGNAFVTLDGLYVDRNYNIKVCDDNANFENTGNYKVSGTTKEILYGYTSKVVATNRGGFFPIDASGSGSTYYADSTTVAEGFCGYGGGRYGEELAGAFTFSVGNDPSQGITTDTTRLCYLG